MSAPVPSLYEDWQQRRQHLLGETSSDLSAPAQLRMLNYLLERYAGDAQVQRRARFPLPRSLVCNERRVVVFHHLGRMGFHDSKNKVEAERQVLSVLERMRTTQAEPADSDEDDVDTPPATPLPTRRSLMFWRPVIRKMKLGFNVDDRIRVGLQQSRYLPRAIVQHLCRRLENTGAADVNAAHLLVACRNPRVTEWTTRMWRLRVSTSAPNDQVRSILEEHFRSPDVRPFALEKIRVELADENANVRLAAIKLIAEIGNLDDVGLLIDLLALPQNKDEGPGEREAFEQALWALRNGSYADS